MFLGFFFAEEEGEDAKGRRVKRSTVGTFNDIPEETADGMRVGKVETSQVTEVFAAAPRVVRDASAPAIAGKTERRRRRP